MSLSVNFRVSGFEFRVGDAAAALPDPKPATRNPKPRAALRVRARAFTLVEIMIVVAILGVILGFGIPSMFRAMNREGIRAATTSVLDACAKARSAAILSGAMVELRILPESKQLSLQVGAAPEPEVSVVEAAARVEVESERPPAPRPTIAPFSATLADNISIELLDVNYLELKDAPEVRVKFHPNGTSDEFTIVLRSARDEWRKVSLEVTTALANLEVIK